MNLFKRFLALILTLVLVSAERNEDEIIGQYSKETAVPIVEFLANPLKFALSNRPPSAELLEIFEPLKDASAEDFSKILLHLMENPIVHRRVIDNPRNFRKVLEVLSRNPAIMAAVLDKDSIFVMVFTHSAKDLANMARLVKDDSTWIQVVFQNPSFLLKLYKDPATLMNFEKLVQQTDPHLKQTLKKNPDLI